MSSSSKFFTWHPTRTKTPQASYEKSPSRPKRIPIPLEFEPLPQRSSRTTESIALQDAAVQSATSLLAVMNDCLNTHLLTTQHSGGLQPGFGRPRSHTAPSTPMAEAGNPPLAELEGSIPTRPKHSVKQSLDSNSMRKIMQSPQTTYGSSIERPHSSPQESTHKIPVYPRKSYDSFSRGSVTYPPMDPVSRAKGGSPFQRVRTHSNTIPNTSDDTLVATESDSTLGKGRRPSLNVWSNEPRTPPSITGSRHDSHTNSTHAVPQIPSHWVRRPSSAQDADPNADSENVLLEQIAAMRASHEAHIAALKETHERELASHKSYISILENRRSRSQAPRPVPRKTLTIDTQAAGQGGGLLSSDASATTSLQSFELSLDSQRRVSSDAAAETEALKRKLSLARRTTAEIGDVRRERDQLREVNERNDRRITQLKEIIRKHKDSEKSLKNDINGHEAALLAANNQRLDALEGFYEACEQVNKASQREKFLAKELDDIQKLLSHVDPKWTKPPLPRKCENAQEVLLKRRKTLRQDPLLQQLDELRRAVVEKDMRIGELEAATQLAHQTKDSEENRTRKQINDMKLELERIRQKAVDAESARDKYNSLLHTELRRQNRSAAQKGHVMTPQLDDQASMAFVQRIRKMSTSSEKTKPELAESNDNQISLVEKELRHCTQEIILYKLDIKGYKKDLKNANAEIEALRAVAQQPLPNMSSPPPALVENRSHMSEHSRQHTPAPPAPNSGLGISWPTALTPGRTIASATSEALRSTTPTPQPRNTPLASPMRPKTPLGTHKKLPKPPPSSSPNLLPLCPPNRDMQRQETLRSLSESIISSYAKRTPEQGKTPPRGRSSDPPRSSAIVAEAIPMPVAKYRPEMLKTPTMAIVNI